MPLCTTCLQPYPSARQALGYTTCIQCSNVAPYKAGVHYGHKTAGELDIMPATQYNKYRKATYRKGKHSTNMSRTSREHTSHTI